MIRRLLRWWRSRSEFTIEGSTGSTAYVSTAVTDGEYSITIDDDTFVVRARWWDTRASIARKLQRKIRA